jgi:Low affinity iron permease
MRATLPIGVFSSGGHNKASTFFARMANATATWTGKPFAFLTAVAVVVVWGISGPIFHYSDTWQLVTCHQGRQNGGNFCVSSMYGRKTTGTPAFILRYVTLRAQVSPLASSSS